MPTFPRGITLGGLSSGKPLSSLQGIADELTDRGTLSELSALSVEHYWIDININVTSLVHRLFSLLDQLLSAYSTAIASGGEGRSSRTHHVE